MSTPDHSRFDELLSRYIDASLGDAEEHELLQYLSEEDFASRFHEATRLDTEIAGILAGSIPDNVMIGLVWSDLALAEQTSPAEESIEEVKIPARKRSYAPGYLALTACISILAVAGYHYSHTPQSQPHSTGTPDVASVSGEVYFIDASGKVPLTGDQPLTGDGKIMTVGPDSHVTLHLADGTRFELEGDTTLETQLSRAKPRIFLSQGCFHAKVAKQGEGRALLFDTLNAEATVHGTEFTLLWHQSTTYLIVTEGAVGIKRLMDGPEIVVKTDYFCHIEPDGIYHTWPKSYLPKWFNSGPPLKR